MNKIFIYLFIFAMIQNVEQEKVVRVLIAIDSTKKPNKISPEISAKYYKNWFPDQKARGAKFLNIVSKPFEDNFEANKGNFPKYFPSNMLHELATEIPPMFINIKGKKTALIPCQSIDPNSKPDSRLLEILFAKLNPKVMPIMHKKKRDCHKSWLKEALYKKNRIKKYCSKA